MNNKEQRLVENMKMISVELTNKQVSQFIKFYEMLVEWNKVMNLTGITEYDEVVMKHFVDSLSIVKVNGFDNVQILGGKIEEVVKFQLPDTDIGRSFVKIKKNKNTAKKYPRKAGLPAKEPL